MNNRLIPDVLDQGVASVIDSLGLDFTFSEVSFGIFGFILVLMMVLRPEGLLPERRRKIELTERRRHRASPSLRGARVSLSWRAADHDR